MGERDTSVEAASPDPFLVSSGERGVQFRHRSGRDAIRR
jgi:hypothetical protein